MIQYIHFIPILRDNLIVSIPLLILFMLIIYFLGILIVIKAIKNIQLNKIIIIIIRIILPFFTITFFSQIYLSFITVFKCTNEFSFINAGIKCRTGKIFTIFAPLSIIALILHIILSIITNILYFKPIFSTNHSDILKKSNSIPDIVFLFTKIAINSLFILDKNEEEEHWTLIFFLLLISGINAYFTFFYQNRVNNILIILNKNFSFILLFSSLSLFLGKIFRFTALNGLLFFFFISIILIEIFIFLKKDDNLSFILIDHFTINNSRDLSNYITKYYMTFINKNNSRSDSIVFKSLIDTIEEKCINIDCPLKKYLSNIKKRLDGQYLLIIYCDTLFQYGIRKFSSDIHLKINYIAFLLTTINNIKKALIMLDNIEGSSISFRIGYNIHLYRHFIDKFYNTMNEEEDYSLIKHQNDVTLFKDLIKKVVLSYNEFISLLLECKGINNNNNFIKINKIGQQIIKYKKKIKEFIEQIKNIKNNNNEIIKLYLEYNRIILNDQDNNDLNFDYCDIDNLKNNNKIDYFNLNTQSLKEKDNLYLLISVNEKNLV